MNIICNRLYAVGEFFMVGNKPAVHTLLFTENDSWDVRWVAFDGYASAHILSQFGMTAPIVIRPQDISILQKLYSKMYTIQKTDRVYGDFYCSGYIYAYIIEFHRLMDTKENNNRFELFQLYTNINNKSEHIVVHKCVRIMSKWLPKEDLT